VIRIAGNFYRLERISDKEHWTKYLLLKTSLIGDPQIFEDGHWFQPNPCFQDFLLAHRSSTPFSGLLRHGFPIERSAFNHSLRFRSSITIQQGVASNIDMARSETLLDDHLADCKESHFSNRCHPK
jgi:hypothetical protein